jgi:hypothetical protein
MVARLEQLVQQHLASISGVEAIFAVREGSITHVWTAVDSRHAEDAVFDGEGRILDQLRRPTVDFHVTSSDAPPPSGATCLFRRRRRETGCP